MEDCHSGNKDTEEEARKGVTVSLWGDKYDIVIINCCSNERDHRHDSSHGNFNYIVQINRKKKRIKLR